MQWKSLLERKKKHIEEASSSLYGLLYYKGMNMEKTWLEGDSLNIIDCLNKVTTPSWNIQSIICKVINLINSFPKYVVTHNYRETNKVDDWEINMACKNNMKMIWNNVNDIPIDGLSMIEYDRIGSRETCF